MIFSIDEIGFGGGRGADGDGLVGHFDMQRVGVGVRIDRDGLDPEFAARS